MTVPGELTDLNSFIDQATTHWAKSGKSKKEDTQAVKLVASQYADEITEDDLPIDVHCHWVTESRRKDKDNIRFAMKMVLDGLEEAGLIPNDGWKEIGKLSDSFERDKHNPHVEITITKS